MIGKIGQMIGRTSREASGGEWGDRAGYLREIADKPVLLPLGQRVMAKLRALVIEALGPAHEIELLGGEVAWPEIAKAEINSHRQLPMTLRLCRTGNEQSHAAIEQAYLLQAEGEIEVSRQEWVRGLEAALSELGLAPSYGGTRPEWIYLHPQGSDRLLSCPGCGYAAAEEWAEFRRPPGPEAPQTGLMEVETPGATTIQALTNALGIEASQTLKSMFFAARNGAQWLAIIRGDLDLSMPKLEQAADVRRLFPSDPLQLEQLGSSPGFGGPMGLKLRPATLGDLSLLEGGPFVVGANKLDLHLQGVKYPQDFQVDELHDLAQAHPGDACLRCGERLVKDRGRRLAGWEQHRRWLDFADEEGRKTPGWVGLGSVDLHNLLWSVMRAYSDDSGFSWPVGLAPYHVYLLSIRADERAESIAHELSDSGLDVLLDDRPQSAGVKFADADLIGCPVRLIVSARAVESDQFELTRRRSGETSTHAGVDLTSAVKHAISELM